MSLDRVHITPELDAYLKQVSDREPELLSRLREETKKRFGDSVIMQISAEQGQFMSLLTRLVGAKNALEVGTFTGYSSICVASALPTDGQLIACDISEEFTALAREFWRAAGLEKRIDLHLGPATGTLQQLVDTGRSDFDIAFIDADKENYRQYYELCLQLIRPGGLILIDNVLWSGQVVNPDAQDPNTLAIRALNEHVHADKRVEMILLPLCDGLTMARKR